MKDDYTIILSTMYSPTYSPTIHPNLKNIKPSVYVIISSIVICTCS